MCRSSRLSLIHIFASLQVIPGMALGMAMITVVGQCIGAKDYEAVKKYTKKLMLSLIHI